MGVIRIGKQGVCCYYIFFSSDSVLFYSKVLNFYFPVNKIQNYLNCLRFFGFAQRLMMLNRVRVHSVIGGVNNIGGKNRGRIRNENPAPVPDNCPFEMGFCADQNIFRRQKMEVL
jgi:hypothetical protein